MREMISFGNKRAKTGELVSFPVMIHLTNRSYFVFAVERSISSSDIFDCFLDLSHILFGWIILVARMIIDPFPKNHLVFAPTLCMDRHLRRNIVRGIVLLNIQQWLPLYRKQIRH